MRMMACLDRRVQRVALSLRRHDDDGDGDDVTAGVCLDCPKRLATKTLRQTWYKIFIGILHIYLLYYFS